MWFVWVMTILCLCGEILCTQFPRAAPVTIEAVTPPIQHGEGPWWSSEKGLLYYVDTFQATALVWNPCTSTVTRQKFEKYNSIAIIIPMKDSENQFVVGCDRYVLELTWDGKQNDTGVIREIDMVEKNKPKNQFNDGKVDANGWLWIGSLERNADNSVTPFGGSLYLVKNDTQPELKLDATSISNGLTWSSDNKRFFYIDSQTKEIQQFNFNLETGSLSDKKVLFNVEENGVEGLPDGMTIDSEDNLWIALFGGHGVINVDSRTGKLLRFIELPVTYVTSAIFGGPKLEILYVTTSRKELTDEQLAKEPLAGSVLAVKGLRVKGLPSHQFIYKTCGNCKLK